MGNICSGGQEKSKASAFAPVRVTEDRSESHHDLDDNNGNKQAFNSNDSNQSIFDNNGHPLKNQQQLLLSDASPTDPTAATPNNNNDNAQQLLLQQKQQRDEQNRLDAIVQMAGRGMVSVRSTRGSTGYYDQGFAAALGQHLERTTTFVDQLPIRLPPPPPAPAPKKSSQSQQQQQPVVAVTNSSGTNSNSVHNNNDTAKKNGKTTATTMNVIQRLSQPPWENIALGTKGSGGGGGGGFGGENPHAYMDLVAANLLDAVVPKKERIFHNNDNNDGNGGGGGGRVGPMVENLL